MSRASIIDLDAQRFAWKAAALHRRGPRLITEFLAEIGRDRLITTDIEQRLDRYLAIDEDALDLLHGCELPGGRA